MSSNNMNVNNDDDTIPTVASSFVQVDATQVLTTPLSLVLRPRHDTIGVDVIDTTKNEEYAMDHVCITVTAQDMEDDAERSPVDIQVALDVSGSMASKNKLNLCKTTLEFLVRFLQPQDRFGLITYATDARIDLPLQHLTPAYKDRCLSVIRSLHTRGSTNISAAVGLAAQEMAAVTSPNPVRSILLLTDGHANGGIADTPGLVQLVQNSLGTTGTSVAPASAAMQVQVQSQPSTFMGFDLAPMPEPASSASSVPSVPPTQLELSTHIPISLHTFGYGADHNEDLLQNMANTTAGGTYYFVEDDKNVGAAFGDAIGGVVSVVAQNAVVQVQVPPAAAALGVRIEKVHHDQAILREDGSYSITLGDFYAEETRDVILSVKLAVPHDKQSSETALPHVLAKVRYTDTLQRRPTESPWTAASIARPLGSSYLSEENVHVAAQWLRVYGVEQMARADALASANNFAGAQNALQFYSSVYREAPAAVQSHAVSVGVMSSATTMMSDLQRGQAAYRAVGSKRSKQTVASHRGQRSTFSAAGGSSFSAYSTKKKTATRSKFSTK